MIVIIMLFIILSISFGIKIKLKISQEEAIFVSLYGITLFAYILGLFNLLGISIYAIGICSLIALVYTVIKLVRKDVSIKELITMPTVIYVVIMCFTYYIVKDIKIGADYDEYMFWATNLKQMMAKNCLWANYKIDGIHLVYPPFTAVTEYIFCKFNGGYNDGAIYFGMISLMITAILPIFKNEKYKISSFIRIVLGFVFTYLAIVLFKFNIANIAVDCIIGVNFAAAMYIGYLAKEKKDYIVLIMLLISITLIKTNGMLFAGIVVMQMFLNIIFKRCTSNNKKEFAREILMVVIMLAIIIFTYITWKVYYTANGKQIDDRHDKNYVENIDLKEFVNAILLKNEAEDRNKEIVKTFKRSMTKTRIIRKHQYNTTWCVFGAINILSIIYLLICKDKLKTFANFLSINIGFFIYILTNLLMFMFVFQAYQGETVMGFDRYMQTYLLAMLLNIGFFLLNNPNKKFMIGVVVLTLLIQSKFNRTLVDPRKYPRSKIDERTIENSNYINNNVAENEKVFIIDQKLDGGVEFVKTKYLIAPRETNLLYEWNIGNSTEGVYYKIAFTEEEFLEKLKNENYDYIYIISINERFLDDYKNIFSEQIKEKLNKIILEGDEVIENGILINVKKEIFNLD